MPAFIDLPARNFPPYKFPHPWEHVAEAVWNRYPSPQCFKERLQKDVVSKRLSPNQQEAVIERLVTYNYSEKVPFYLQPHIGSADRFEMKETLTFNWVSRTLTVEVVNVSARPMIKYQERAEYTVDTENNLRTALRVSGSSNCDIPLMMSQFGDDACKDIYNHNFTSNINADTSLLEERAGGKFAKEMVGYFPEYLREEFLLNTDPALLPPLPPAQRSPGAALSMDMKTMPEEPNISDEEAARKLPTLAPLHTFAPNALAGPTPPPLEIYGVARSATNVDDMMGTRGTTTSQGASSLVMF